jgi:hypothetical protein
MLYVFSVIVFTQYPSGAVMNKRGNRLNMCILHFSRWNLKGIYATKGIRDFEILRGMFVNIQILWHIEPFQLVHSYRVYYLHLLDLLDYITSSYLKLSYTSFRVTSKVNKQTSHSSQMEQGFHKLNVPQDHHIPRLNLITPCEFRGCYGAAWKTAMFWGIMQCNLERDTKLHGVILTIR